MSGCNNIFITRGKIKIKYFYYFTVKRRLASLIMHNHVVRRREIFQRKLPRHKYQNRELLATCTGCKRTRHLRAFGAACNRSNALCSTSLVRVVSWCVKLNRRLIHIVDACSTAFAVYDVTVRVKRSNRCVHCSRQIAAGCGDSAKCVFCSFNLRQKYMCSKKYNEFDMF